MENKKQGDSNEKEKKNPREEVHSVAALLDALLPVLHEVSQGQQGVINDGDLIFKRPGFHGYQDNASIELLFVDLDTSNKKEAN